MSDPVYGDQFAALRQENARLRAQLDATAQAHERDVVRLARALGWTHEPPASVDEVVERAAALHAENARLTAERDALARGSGATTPPRPRTRRSPWTAGAASTRRPPRASTSRPDPTSTAPASAVARRHRPPSWRCAIPLDNTSAFVYISACGVAQ